MSTFYDTLIHGIARFCLHLKYGMSVDDYYEQLSRGPFSSATLSDEAQAFSDALCHMATVGKISLAATHQEIEPSPSMDYYPEMPDWENE